MKVCPGCNRDADTLSRKDGTLRAHGRPVMIPGGLAASDCPGSGQPPVEQDPPAWLVNAFKETS